MIISRMDGGLGNQMFQYAYGLYLARRHATSLLLDIGSYNSAPQHGFLLDRFRIDAGRLGAGQQNLIPPRYRAPAADPTRTSPARTSNWLDRLPVVSWATGSLRRHKEAPFGFKPKHLDVPNNRYLVGYWQSQDYFPGLRAELLEHFQLREPLSKESQRIAERMRASNSAAIHVRRGDYITDRQAASIYQRLELDYYLESLEDWAASQSDLEVFVFSNDIAWCRENMGLRWKTHWVDHTCSDTAHEDMILMSLAACNIIANSTFSWWSAWMNRRPGKVVYAPAHWFQPGTLDEASIVPPEWKRTRYMTHQAA